MHKKTIIQILLFFFIILILAVVFYLYFYDFKKNNENNENNENNKNNEKISIQDDYNLNENSSNLIEKLEYTSIDRAGNKFIISSKTGSIDEKDNNIIFMQNVEAKIYMLDSSIININADFAKYNSKNYETNFSQNVGIKYLNHKIFCDNLELYIEKNIALLRNNIIYKNYNTTIKGDRLEIDLITKNSIMTMNDKSEKIIISGKTKNGNN